MSMSEFEKQLNDMWEVEPSGLPKQGAAIPADFSDEDIAFAQELDSFFDIAREDIPPYYVQTLLDAENLSFQPVANSFEYKTRARVFRRLKLCRRLPSSNPAPFKSFARELPLRKALMPVAALLLFILLTVAFTGPSFAAGMQILLRGSKIGIMGVQHYPNNVKLEQVAKKSPGVDPDPDLSMQAAQARLHNWSLYWPGQLPDNYTLSKMYLYRGQQQSWVDGPFMELDFSLKGAKPKGTGLLAIREFKLKSDVKVFRVVKNGAYQPIQVDQNGQPQEIYVDGQWVMHNRLFPVWVYGQRSELFYQKDGVVFWIVGDQRDGIGKNELLNIANSLQVFRVSHALHIDGDTPMNSVSLLQGDVNSPFTGDVLAIFSDDTNAAPNLTLVGSQSTSTSAPVSSSSHISHSLHARTIK